jgi:hypothetical protein
MKRQNMSFVDIERPEFTLFNNTLPDIAYTSEDKTPYSSINVIFPTPDDRRAFLSMLNIPLDRKQSIYFPFKELEIKSEQRPTENISVPICKYPIYIISKGRHESRKTVKALELLNIDYKIVIEPQEYNQYATVIDPDNILVLPFSDLGQGSIPARNWVWDHAVSSGHKKHWILDDNIGSFYRMNANKKWIIRDENPFIPIERFCDKFSNIALSGMHYQWFEQETDKLPPFLLNTRIYSCILIDHICPFRWRGRYNEDTDLSLRVLKAGYCTVLFIAYLCHKTSTMILPGGNTDELYQGNGRLLMAESLRDQHPDVVTITTKWGRPQHQVNYKPFRTNRLIPIPILDL